MTDANDLAEGSFPTRCVWLPLYNEAKEIVDKYLADISYIHHVVHRPSLYALVDDLYRDIDGNRPIPLGHVTLLLAILANATFFWNDQDLRRPIFSSVDQANGQTPAWMRTALEVLEHSRRKGTESLEDIQSLIILSFLLTNFVGITSQVRHFYVAATNLAMSLSLHRIDHPKEGAPGFPPDSLPAEMGRRVWWYLMATDWYVFEYLVLFNPPIHWIHRMFSQFVGPQKGTYSINPKHTATRKPLNIDDEDLIDGLPYVAKPMDQPTSISYSLQRIHVAEVCRDFSDSFPLAEPVENVGYHRVLHIDQMISNIAAAMPPFFSLDYDSYQLPEADRTGVTLQRYTIHLIIYSIKCRLHMPYLSRVAAEAKYTFSRDAALSAARTVIRTSRLLCQETKTNIQSVSKLSGYLHFVCMAIIALLMDLCLHKSPCPNDDKERRAEIFSAFQILEDGKEYSEFASKFLEAFYSVLRKNKVPYPPVEGQSKRPPETIEQPASFDPNEPEMNMEATDRASNMPFNDSIIPTLNDLWQDFDTNMDPSVDWTALFDDFDSPFL